MTTQTPRCIAYTRLNVGADHAAESLRVQREAIQAFIKTQDWTCVATYEDVGYSASTPDRPELGKLRATVKAGGIDYVVVPTFDRLARKSEHCKKLIAEFRRRGVTIVTAFPCQFINPAYSS